MSDMRRMAMTKVIRAVADASSSVAATTTRSGPAPAVTRKINRQATSGLTSIEVILTLAVLFGLFVGLLIVGELCKIFNKPKAEATPYKNNNQHKLFQPSAAGYGTRAAGLKAPEGNAAYSSRLSLLAGASPMGYSNDDMKESPYGTPNSQGSSGKDYFGRNGHTRGSSSGIQLPGATASTARRGNPTHPPVNGTSIAPDGSGYQVGQPVNFQQQNQRRGGPSSPNGYAPQRSPVPGPSFARPQHQHRATHSRVGMGPPPASDARRRSRYARNDNRRIDSIGPGAIRKSMFMPDEGNPFPEGAPRSGTNMRRVDSIGKGDHRRKSTFDNGSGRRGGLAVHNLNNNYDSSAESYGGSSDPLGVKPLLAPALPGPPRGSSPQPTQMQPLRREISPNTLPSPNAMGRAPTIGRTTQQQQTQQMRQAYPGQGFPGGGMPRMPANRGFSPVGNAYDRGARQVV